MGSLRKRVRNIAQTLINNFTSSEMEQFGSRTFAIFSKKRKADVWFSYRAQVRSVFEQHGINIVIDAGANEGQFAQQLREFYPGKIFSFEPVSSTFEKLAAAAAADPNWYVYKLALGSEATTQTINISDATVFSSLLKTNDYCAEQFGERAQGKREEVVAIQRLDALLAEITAGVDQPRIFLKMDTQGFDTEVFKGLGTQTALVSALQSEVSLISIYQGMPHWTDSIAAYEQAGFGVVGMFPVTRDAGRIVEYDCLMAKAKP